MKQLARCPICGATEFEDDLPCVDTLVSKTVFPLVRCQGCGFVATSIFPEEEEMGAYYQSEEYVSHSDTQAGLFFKLYHWVRSWMLRSKANRVIAATKELRKQRVDGAAPSVLDYGCGTGYFAHTMQSAGWRVTGVEINAAARAFASNHFSLHAIAPEAMKELPSHSFDAITLWHVMEHVEHLDHLLAELNRLLRPGGSLVIALPNCGSYDAHYYRQHWAAYDVPRHLWHFTADSFGRLMKEYGWVLLSTARMPFDGFYISMMSEAARTQGSHTLALLRGAVVGTIGWLVSLFHKRASSSLIYTLRRR